MKMTGLALAMLLVGYLLGGWGPKGKLLEAESKLTEAKQAIAKKSRNTRSTFGGVNHILDIPDHLPEKKVSQAKPGKEEPVQGTHLPEKKVSQAKPRKEEAVQGTQHQPVAGHERIAEEGNHPAGTPKETPEQKPKTFQENREVAADAWAVRSEIARKSFVERVDLKEPEAIRFNVLVESMNIRIGTTIDQFVEDAWYDEEIVGEELGLRLVSELSDIMVMTYDELDRNMPAGWREYAGKGFSLTDLVDPHVAMPLVDLENRLNAEKPE